MIVIDVYIAKGMNELARFEIAYLSNHQGQQRVGGDVKGYAKEKIGASLIKLTRQFTIGHIELEQKMTGWQRHFLYHPHIPGAHHQPARVGILSYLLNQVRDLIHMPAIGSGPRTPLVTINRAQVALRIGPFVPDGHAIFGQILRVCVAM